MRPPPLRITDWLLVLLVAVSGAEVYQWSLKAADGRVQLVWVEHGPEGVRGALSGAIVPMP